jgi:hypothetical protein
MTFTYDLANADPDIALISRVRLEIGDTVEDDGVTPSGSNLSDEEIAILLAREGGEMRATAAACELLSRQWSRVANIAVGPRREDLGKVAEDWRKSAAEIRERYGYASGGRVSVSGLTRVDGYSDDIASDEV